MEGRRWNGGWKEDGGRVVVTLTLGLGCTSRAASAPLLPFAGKLIPVGCGGALGQLDLQRYIAFVMQRYIAFVMQ